MRQIPPLKANPLLYLAAIAMLVSVSAGCSSSSSGQSSSSSNAPTSTNNNGVLRITGDAITQSFDPIKNASSGSDSWLDPVYDTLFYAAPNNQIEPMLATSWKVIANPPALQMTLRQGVTFHNGDKFNAEVVKENIERDLSATSLLVDDLSQVKSVTVLGPYRVQINTTVPAPDLPVTLSDLPGMMVDPAMFNSPSLSTQGAGTGAYVVSTFRPGAEIIYTRVPGYWDPSAAKVKEIIWSEVDDANAMLNDLLTGQADLVELVPGQLQRAQATPGFRVMSGPELQDERLLFNTSKSEFGNELVREAINYGINREAIVTSLLQGFCTATSSYAPPGNIMYSPETPPSYYAYNPAKAESLLRQAGLPHGFTFTTLVVDNTHYLPYAQAIQAELKSIGVTMKLQPVNPSDIVNEFYVDHIGDALIAGDVGAASPTEYAQQNYLPNGIRNVGGLSSPQIENLVEKVSTTVNPAQQAAYWNQLTQAATAFAWGAELCVRTQNFALDKNVVGFQLFPNGQISVRGVSVNS